MESFCAKIDTAPRPSGAPALVLRNLLLVIKIESTKTLLGHEPALINPEDSFNASNVQLSTVKFLTESFKKSMADCPFPLALKVKFLNSILDTSPISNKYGFTFESKLSYRMASSVFDGSSLNTILPLSGELYTFSSL